MSWFLGMFGVVVALAIISTLTGRATLGAVSRRPPSHSPEAFAMAALVGTAAWTLLAATLSNLGLGAPTIVLIAHLAVTVLIVHAVRRWGVHALLPRPRDRLALAPLGLALLAGLQPLLPVAIGNGYVAHSDSAFYVASGEYLQTHGIGPALAPGAPYLRPVATVWMSGFLQISAWGAELLLALVQAGLPGSRAVEVYPAVAAWGVGLNVAGVFLLARRALHVRREFALLAALLFAVTPNPVQYGAAAGLFRQTYGTATLAFALALLPRALGPRPFDWRYALLLATAYAFVLVTYEPLGPILAVTTILAAGAAAYRAWRRGQTLAFLTPAGLTLVFWLLFTNAELVRQVKAIPFALSMQHGAGVTVSAGVLEFVAFFLGAMPEPPTIPTGGTVGPLLALTLVGGVALLLGLASALRRQQLTILGASTVLLGLVGYYALIATNPATGQTGQAFYVMRLGYYGYPLVLALQAAGVASLGRWAGRPVLLVSLGLVVTVLALPVVLAQAQARAGSLQSFVGSAQPLQTLHDLGRAVARSRPDVVYLLMPRRTLGPGGHNPTFTQLMYSAVLAPHEVLADVLDPPSDPGRPKPAGRVLYLAVGPWSDAGPPSGGRWLAPNVMVVSDAAVLGISNPYGIDRAAGKPLFWLGPAPMLIEVGAARDGTVRLELDALPGPDLPGSTTRHIAVSTSGGHTSVEVIAGAGSVAVTVPLLAGDNLIAVACLDQPTAPVVPGGQTRPTLLAISNLSVRLLEE